MNTQREIRAAFWEAHPHVSRKKITNYSGDGKMYCTDTRTAFVDYVDALYRDGIISQQLADTVTL